MNMHTFYDDLKAYLDSPVNTTLVANGFSIKFSTTTDYDKFLIITTSDIDRSDESKVTRIDTSFLICAVDYELIHAVMETVRAALHKTRNFLIGFQTSYAFCDGISDAEPNPSQTKHVPVKDGLVFAMFNATILVEDSV